MAQEVYILWGRASPQGGVLGKDVVSPWGHQGVLRFTE